MIYAAIDTNVLVSALLSKHDDAATVQVIERAWRRCDPCVQLRNDWGIPRGPAAQKVSVSPFAGGLPAFGH